MTYAIRCRGEVIGTAVFEHFDDGMSVAFGTFHPTAAYERVRAIFRLYADAISTTLAQPANEERLAQYYRERDALGLELVDTSGRVIPTGFVHIHDYVEEVGGEAYQVEAQIADRRVGEAAQGPQPTG